MFHLYGQLIGHLTKCHMKTIEKTRRKFLKSLAYKQNIPILKSELFRDITIQEY